VLLDCVHGMREGMRRLCLSSSQSSREVLVIVTRV
jgi:hypothetical protein